MTLLPGETLVNGVSNFCFGSNVPIFDTNTVYNTPQIQSQLKTGGFTILRCPFNVNTPDSLIDQAAAGVAAAGCAMLVILSHSSLSWNQHLVTRLGTSCKLYELSNEPDLNGISASQYVTLWNQHIPAIRAINPTAAYMGPALGVPQNFTPYATTWLAGCKASGVLPDAVSFHYYGCYQLSSSVCATRASTYASMVSSIDSQVQGVLGHSLPLCLTEWSIDPSSPRASYTTDPTFVTPWVHTAMDSIASSGLAIACQFYTDDLVQASSPYSTGLMYQPMVDKIIQYLGTGSSGGGGGGGGGGTSTPLTFYLTASTSSTLSTANALYNSVGTPSTTHTYSRVGTATHSGEVTAQGTTSAWAALTSGIGNPTGKGFFLDVTTLVGKDITAGQLKASIRLSCAQNGDTNSAAGTLTADLFIRLSKYNGGTYTPFALLSASGQTIPSTPTTFPLTGTLTSAVSFISGDKLYVDIWPNVTANTNGSSVQDIRLANLSTDTTYFAGDPDVSVTIPGLTPTPTPTPTGTGNGDDNTYTAPNSYILNNLDLSVVNSSGQRFKAYMAFLNPIAITTNWTDITQDNQGNWQPPSNVDTCASHLQPYAPTVNMGGNRIGFVGEPLYFDGTRSNTRFDLPVVDGSYHWTITGLYSIEYYHWASQVAITWSAPGLYTVSLTVTDLYGNRTTGIRQVMVYADRDSALPGVISISGLSGSLSGNGWQCQLTTVNSQVTLLPPDLLPVGTYLPIVVMMETAYEVIPDLWVERTIGPHGTFSPGQPYRDPRVFFDGYVQNGTFHQDVDKDTLSFTCMGPQMILQESKTHQLGYYNTTVKTTGNGQVPTSLNTSPVGQGYLVNNLTSADIIHSLLQTHCNLGTYHDIHCWNANIPVYPYVSASPNNAYFNLIYTTLSVNEGTIAQNITDISANEWAQWYTERDGGIYVGPQVNYRGSDYWHQPTLVGQEATNLINFVQELGYSVGSNLPQMGQNLPVLPAQPMPIQFVHPWGHQPMPPQVLKPFGGADAQRVANQKGLNGPPILCSFSDVPLPDPSALPPGGTNDPYLLFPWIKANWPQDLSVYPISFDFPGNYTGRTSLVKLIGTLYGTSGTWSSWYPQNAFVSTNNTWPNIVQATLPAGNWSVDQSHVLADITVQQNVVLVSHWWWEIARRVYFAQNVNYSGSVTCAMFTGVSLSDIVAITRQNNALGPHWYGKPFYVTQIDYSIDLTARTWQTSLTMSEVTSILLGPPINPPSFVSQR